MVFVQGGRRDKVVEEEMGLYSNLETERNGGGGGLKGIMRGAEM